MKLYSNNQSILHFYGEGCSYLFFLFLINIIGLFKNYLKIVSISDNIEIENFTFYLLKEIYIMSEFKRHQQTSINVQNKQTLFGMLQTF